MALTIDQAQELAGLWANAANINNARAVAPNTITEAVFLAIVQEAWDQMVAAAATAPTGG